MAVGRDVTGPRRFASPGADRLATGAAVLHRWHAASAPPRGGPRARPAGPPRCSWRRSAGPAARRRAHRGTGRSPSCPSRKGRPWTGPPRRLPWTRHRLPGRRSPCAPRSTSPRRSRGAAAAAAAVGSPDAARTSPKAGSRPAALRRHRGPHRRRLRGHRVGADPAAAPGLGRAPAGERTVLVSGQFRATGRATASCRSTRRAGRCGTDVIPFEVGTELASGARRCCHLTERRSLCSSAASPTAGSSTC